MSNVLFVLCDDSLNSELPRYLSTRGAEWTPLFASTLEAAKQILSTTDIEVVAVDLTASRTPESELLSFVSDKYPGAIRIGISTFARPLDASAAAVAHQYLAKPIDIRALTATIDRLIATRELILDQDLRDLVSKLPTFPSLPSLYQELVAEIERTDSSLRSIAKIVQKDIGMTAKVLQIVNSAYFGQRRQISDTHSAVEILGIDTIAALTLGLSAFSQLESSGHTRLYSSLWTHAMRVAVSPRKIAVAEGLKCESESFTGGLLHDMGTVLLAANMPRRFTTSRELAKDQGIPMEQAEREVFGATHSQIGGYLLVLWGLPAEVVQAVAFHHSPLKGAIDTFTATSAVYFANALHNYIDSESVFLDEYLDERYLKYLGVADRVTDWRRICQPDTQQCV